LKAKYHIEADKLIVTIGKEQKQIQLPDYEKELAKVDQFLTELEKKSSKIKNISLDMISANSHYVFIITEQYELRVRFPYPKLKHIAVDKDTHKMARLQALKANLPLKDYIRLCLVQCKSDAK
jgi:hypothetical protein